MLTFLAGRPVTVSVPLNVEPVSLSYRVLNANGTELVAPTPVTVVANETVVGVTIPAEINTLTTGKWRELRLVELIVETEQGDLRIEHPYLLEGMSGISVPGESLVSYGEAMLHAISLPDTPGWDGGSKEDRISALMGARRAISSLAFRFEAEDSMSRIDPVYSVDLSELTDAEFFALPADFREALGIASVLQADYLLRRNDTAQMREQGIVVHKVGESSTVFAKERPMKRAVCERAWSVLAKFIRPRSTIIGRA